MTKKMEKFVVRHILEIRHKNRKFSFIDHRGDMGEFVLNKMGWNNIKINNSRIDVADDTYEKILFFSWENFGLQIEKAKDFKIFQEHVDKLIDIIKEYEKYKVDDIYRLGIKSTFFFNNGINFGKLKDIYNKKIIGKSSNLERNMKANLTDTGLFAFDMDSDDGKINFTTGPVTKEEVITKFYQSNLYNELKYKNGIMFDIDLSEENLNNVEINKLKSNIYKKITAIESKFDGFINYIESFK